MAKGELGRILLVDNDRSIALVVESVLNDAGYRVRILSQVEVGLVRRCVDEFQPQCVLLDGQGRGTYGECVVLCCMAESPSSARADDYVHRRPNRRRRSAWSRVIAQSRSGARRRVDEAV